MTGPPLQAAKQPTRLRFTRSSPSFKPAAFELGAQAVEQVLRLAVWVQRAGANEQVAAVVADLGTNDFGVAVSAATAAFVLSVLMLRPLRGILRCGFQRVLKGVADVFHRQAVALGQGFDAVARSMVGKQVFQPAVEPGGERPARALALARGAPARTSYLLA